MSNRIAIQHIKNDALRKWTRATLGNSISLQSATDGNKIVFANKRKFFLKCYENFSRFENDILGCSFAREVVGIRVPSIIGTNRHLLVVLFEYIDNVPLNYYIYNRPNGRRLDQVVLELGRIVRRMHDVSLHKVGGLPVCTLSEVLHQEHQKLRRALTKIQKANRIFSRHANKSEFGLMINVLQKLDIIIGRLSANKFDTSMKNVFVHGDLWSANVVVERGSEVRVGLVDFEWSMICDPIIDFGRVYSRGFVNTDMRSEYAVTPPDHLWKIFKEGYGVKGKLYENPMHLNCAIAYGLLRTITFCASQSLGSMNIRRPWSASTIKISNATIGYLEKGSKLARSLQGSFLF